MMGSSSTTRADVAAVVMALLAFAAVSAADTAQCGRNASWALCHNCACCSDAGFCGTTDAYCGHGCQSQCHGGCGHDLASIVSPSLFEHLLLHRNDAICPARGFYTYHALVAATRAFPDFATTGDADTRKREIAAFLAQTSHETTGGCDTAPDGPYTWGYCYKEEVNPVSDYCQQGNTEWPCVPGKSYYGRGPMQISWNYNYGPAGNDTAIAADLLADPDLVARDAEVAFKTALWFWMTPQPPKPSAHDVITGLWIPTQEDYEARREPGFGVITNIVNGGAECGQGKNQYADDRVGFYKRYCDMLGVSYGDNLDCDDQEPFDETTTATAVSLSAAAAATAAI